MNHIFRKGARMHLPRVRAIPIILILVVGVWLGLLGCAGEAKPPPTPTEVSVSDIPFDDGSNVAISWRHFGTSSARRYNIYYTNDPDSLESHIDDMEPLSRSLQATIYNAEDTTESKVDDLEYYLVLEETETGIPQAEVVKATPENRDSLKSIGELIVATENDFCPSGRDNRELKFALGRFFRVKPPEGEIKNFEKTLLKSTLVVDSAGLKVGEGRGGLLLELSVSDEEKQFIEKGERIVPYSDAKIEYLRKYGREITGIVTEESRYSLSSEMIQALITNGLEPGTEYHYKIFGVDEKGRKSEPVTGTFTPKDEPPMAPANANAIIDTTDGRLLMTWVGYNPSLAYFRDVDHYEVHRYSEKDTLMETGELIGQFNADFERNIFTDNFSPEDMFCITSIDSAGQRVTGELFGITRGAFGKPRIVRELQLKDVENDDGAGLSVRWGVPTAGITLNVQDFSMEYTPIDIPQGYYLIGNEIQKFEDDSLVPANALPVLGANQWVPPDSFNVTFRYDMYINDMDEIYFAKMRVDSGEWNIDYKELGFMNLLALSAGEHVFEVWLLTESGEELENPEAHVTRTIDINQPDLIREPGPPEYVEIWRGNEPIEKKGNVILAGTPNFDPENLYTFEMVGQKDIQVHQHQDNWPDSLRDTGKYYYFARVVGQDNSYVDSEIMGPKTPTSNFFHSEKTVVLILVILFVAFVNYFLAAARKGKDFYLRPIAGISHLDEALGRATEMGRPIIYVLGLGPISDIATLAGLTILGRVAKKTAEFQTRLIVPCYNPIVLIVAQETVKTAYMDAGRPDAYNEDDVFYAAGSQFSYAAAVAGMMVRFKSAANFYMGMFFAESLILAETGSLAGSIQIAGTDAVTQIPFFITTCDYTLIGEEIYAASAYLSQDPLQVGSLKAQDMLKAIYMVVIVVGTISMTSGFLWFINLFKVRLGE